MTSLLAFSLLICVHIGTLTVLAFGALLAMRRERLYVFVFAALAFYQLMGMFSLGAMVAEFGLDAVLKSELIALAGGTTLLSLLWLAERSALLERFRRAEGAVVTVLANPRPCLLAAGMCMILALVLMLRNGLDFVYLTWQQTRLDASFLDALATLLQFIAFPAVWIAYRGGMRKTALLLLGGTLVLFVVYGSRAALLTLPAVVALDLYLRRRETRAAVPLMMALAAGAMLLHVMTRFLRGFGLAGVVSLLRGEALSGAELLDILAATDFTGGEAAIFRYFVFVVADPAVFDLPALTSVARWLLIYVPSWLVDGMKPSDITYELWWFGFSAGIFDHYESFPQLLKVISAGGGGSLHPLLWGEIWANGGVIALPIAFTTLASIICLMEMAYSRMPPMMYVLAAPATAVGYLMIARGNSVIGLGYFAYIVPIVACLYVVTSLPRFVSSLESDDSPARKLNRDG